jgi:hypothetical protein
LGRHPHAEIHRSQPGIGAVLGARALAGLGDDPYRHADGGSRRNYAATSPITRASGKKKIAAARFACNDRLIDTLNAQAFSALRTSHGARPLPGAEPAVAHIAPVLRAAAGSPCGNYRCATCECSRPVRVHW